MTPGRPRLSRWTLGGGASVLVVVAVLLWQEFFESGQTLWNAFLLLCLVAAIVASVLLQRFFRAHAGEVGEARFDTGSGGKHRG